MASFLTEPKGMGEGGGGGGTVTKDWIYENNGERLYVVSMDKVSGDLETGDLCVRHITIRHEVPRGESEELRKSILELTGALGNHPGERKENNIVFSSAGTKEVDRKEVEVDVMMEKEVDRKEVEVDVMMEKEVDCKKVDGEGNEMEDDQKEEEEEEVDLNLETAGLSGEEDEDEEEVDVEVTKRVGEKEGTLRFKSIEERVKNLKVGTDSDKTERIYPCPHCVKTFARRDSVGRHVRNVHKKSNPPPSAVKTTPSMSEIHSCFKCDSTFSRREYLARHLRAVHKKKNQPSSVGLGEQLPRPNNRRFQCPSCRKSYAQRENLRIHRKKIHASTPSGCSSCPELFFGEKALLKHQKLQG